MVVMKHTTIERKVSVKDSVRKDIWLGVFYRMFTEEKEYVSWMLILRKARQKKI